MNRKKNILPVRTFAGVGMSWKEGRYQYMNNSSNNKCRSNKRKGTQRYETCTVNAYCRECKRKNEDSGRSETEIEREIRAPKRNNFKNNSSAKKKGDCPFFFESENHGRGRGEGGTSTRPPLFAHGQAKERFSFFLPLQKAIPSVAHRLELSTPTSFLL
jgi:hypothetical protein